MKRSILALGLLATLPFAAKASDLSYNYVEGGYTRINGIGPKVDGFAVNGSVALGSRFHVFGGYETVDVPSQRLDLGMGQVITSSADIDHWDIGFGYNHSLSQSTDLVARVGYRDLEVGTPFGGGSFRSKAYFTEVGARAQLATRFEGYVFAGYDRTESTGDGDTYGRIGGQYNFSKNWGLVADVKFGDGVEQYFIGPRFTF